MRATAVVLVIIVGAAVVLWFGNTLNSWVLGGLIGGLAALLISIPITLQLFFFLSRRHDERLDALTQEHEEIALARAAYLYPQVSTEVYEEYEGTEEYEEDEEDYTPEPELEYEDERPRRAVIRDQPELSYPRLPAPGQSHASFGAASQRNSPAARHPASPPLQRKGTQHPQDRRMRNSSFLGYQANMNRSQHQTAALRAARREAMRRQQMEQQENDIEVLPTNFPSRGLPAIRPSQSLIEQSARPDMRPRSSRQLPEQMGYPVQRRRVVEANPSQPTRRPLPAAGESSAKRFPKTDPLQVRASQTDQLRARSQQQTSPMRPQQETEPFRQQRQTNRMTRNPQLTEQSRDPDVVTGSITSPLVRRAPYTYEDDPIRQQLSQQLDAPAVRRSSRNEDESD